VRELTALVQPLRRETMLHPDDAEAGEAWRESRRDLDVAIAALAELLGDRKSAARFRRRAPAEPTGLCYATDSLPGSNSAFARRRC
jgi:hypothetical protein